MEAGIEADAGDIHTEEVMDDADAPSAAMLRKRRSGITAEGAMSAAFVIFSLSEEYAVTTLQQRWRARKQRRQIEAVRRAAMRKATTAPAGSIRDAIA